MNEIDLRVAAALATLEANNDTLAELETLWNIGNPVGVSLETRSAIWRRLYEVREVVFEQIKNEILTAQGVDESLWNQYEYDAASGQIRWVG